MSVALQVAQRVIANVEKVIIGKHREVELTLLALLCRGHILIEDVPGVGKTALAKAISRSLGCTFKRIQFTPDLLPSDITGISIYNQKMGEFEFKPGPILSQIVLADEINRATPKTQSALLESMEERQVTVDGITYPLAEPFIVLATQNPIEYEGTFPLPEAQLDRFMIRISLGYPAARDEIEILSRQQMTHPLDSLGQVVSSQEIVAAQAAVREVYVDELVKQYIVGIVEATRKHEDVYLGASPRGSLALYRGSQARALLDERNYVIPDDVKAVASITLAHRLIMSPSARMKNVTGDSVIDEILRRVLVPGTRVGK
ncbi:MAG: MoxR family ATPase [Chloroflexi bacterium]|uniref:MoxR family ATPase n=1 Tax=Candidatus Chlorohelix allophototropha TaxID=3003348 RepID=A0A8T7M0V1_9CHLR|nr:MoxR family ATPase [Chloroflexota bacterium]WJW67452.1 MoxR family ATPase [Chloroflexota bacterium L227-S17]